MYPVAATLFGILFVIFATWTTYLLVRVQELKNELGFELKASDDHINYLNGEYDRLNQELLECRVECRGLHDKEMDRLKAELDTVEDLTTPASNTNDPQIRRERLRAEVARQQKNHEFEDAMHGG